MSGPEFDYIFSAAKLIHATMGCVGVVRRKIQRRKIIHLPLSSPIIRHVWIRSVRHLLNISVKEKNQWMYQKKKGVWIRLYGWILQQHYTHSFFFFKKHLDLFNEEIETYTHIHDI